MATVSGNKRKAGTDMPMYRHATAVTINLFGSITGMSQTKNEHIV